VQVDPITPPLKAPGYKRLKPTFCKLLSNVAFRFNLRRCDMATMEMESMEEGWVAKILTAEGTEDIPVGQPVAILCEEEADIGKFADYKPEVGPARYCSPRRLPSWWPLRRA